MPTRSGGARQARPDLRDRYRDQRADARRSGVGNAVGTARISISYRRELISGPANLAQAHYDPTQELTPPANVANFPSSDSCVSESLLLYFGLASLQADVSLLCPTQARCALPEW
jgi:hypothetical protein